jgi:cytochrome c-type biogenesis protein CcmH
VQTAQFWSLAMLMVLAATAMLVVPLYWREARLPAGNVWRRWEPLALAAAVPLIALSLYRAWGSPALVDGPGPPGSAANIADAHATAARTGNRKGGDIQDAVARLQARLAANPDDAAGWRLLAQAFEFQGRGTEAEAARARADGLSSPDSRMTGAVRPSGDVATAVDAKTSELVQRAQDFRRGREFTNAVAAFAELERRSALNADLWADYADALGGARGRLDDDAARCIDAALRLDPRHVKALWLRASLQTERREHRAALTTWRQLAALVPAESPDARIIAANLAEARANLAADRGSPANALPDARTDDASVGPTLQGHVRVDPRWRKRISAGSVLFVYARAADERGPPLAVWRTRADTWPVRFSLGDADAMMPGRRLSDFHRVVLEARVSRSGNALPQPGDLRAVSAHPNNSWSSPKKSAPPAPRKVAE